MPAKPDNATANYHSHTTHEFFSGEPGFWKFQGIERGLQQGDVFNADRLGLSAYMITPKGVIKRYDPDPQKGGNGNVTIIDMPKK